MAKKTVNEQKFKPYKPSNYINEVVGTPSDIIRRAKPQKKAYILNAAFNPFLVFVIIWILFDSAFFVGMFFVIENMGGGFYYFILLGVAAFMAIHLMPVWMYIRSLVNASKFVQICEYAYTKDQLFIQVPNKKEVEVYTVNFADVAVIEKREGRIDKRCGVGDIRLITNREFVLIDIEKSTEIYNELRELVFSESTLVDKTKIDAFRL